ncbi:MAG: hypothetical protein HQK69_11225 [Desulfamplus sp.]|nr:hypothetical protein [Desulfamplus sp.]
MNTEGIVTEKKQNRKRKSKKDHLKNGFYAAINPASYKISHIVNINTGHINPDGLKSSGGLVIKYIDKDDHHQSLEQQGKSIFLGNYGYYLGDIPLNGDVPFLIPPSSITIEEVDFTSLTSEHLSKIREMSIMFTELTFNQIFALDKFIREHISHRRFISMHLTVGLQ